MHHLLKSVTCVTKTNYRRVEQFAFENEIAIVEWCCDKSLDDLIWKCAGHRNDLILVSCIHKWKKLKLLQSSYFLFFFFINNVLVLIRNTAGQCKFTTCWRTCFSEGRKTEVETWQSLEPPVDCVTISHQVIYHNVTLHCQSRGVDLYA